MKLSHRRLIPALAISVCLSSVARAAFVAVDITPGTTQNSPSAFSLGWEFTANNSFNVTSLGLFDFQQNGLTSAHNVGIYNSAGTLLGSAVVASGTTDALTGNFRYHTLASPIALTAGQNYVVAASLGPNDPDLYCITPATMTTDFRLHYVTARFVLSSVLAFPTTTDARVGFFGPDFQGAAAQPSVFLTDAGTPNDNPAKENITVTGSAGSYTSTVLDTASNTNSGSVDILGIPSPVTDRPVIVLLDLLNSDSSFITSLASTTSSAGAKLLSNSSVGADLAQWNSIKSLYGVSWDCAVRYDSFTTPSSSSALDFTWDFSATPGVTVDKIAVIPEPKGIALVGLSGTLGLRRVRKVS